MCMEVVTVHYEPFGIVKQSRRDGIPDILGAAGIRFDVDYPYLFRSKPLPNGDGGIRHGEDHISARMLPSLSEGEATHYVSGTGRNGGICTNQKDAPPHLHSLFSRLRSLPMHSGGRDRHCGRTTLLALLPLAMQKEHRVHVVVFQIFQSLLQNQFEIREALGVEVGVVGLPEKSGLAAIHNFGHLRRTILKSPNPAFCTTMDLIHGDWEIPRSNMDQKPRGKNQVKARVIKRNLECRALHHCSPWDPRMSLLHDFFVDLNSYEILKSHLLEENQLVAEIAPNFENRCRSRNVGEKAAVECSAGHSVVALVDLVQILRSKKVSLTVLLAKFSSPFLALLCFGQFSRL